MIGQELKDLGDNLMEQSVKTLMIKQIDNVAVALTPIKAGSHVIVRCQGEEYPVTLTRDIEFGHKFAVKSIKNGTDIIKYGEVIGIAISDIAVGEHVHIHNVDGKRGRGDKLGKQAN